jgi:hypothetical protein
MGTGLSLDRTPGHNGSLNVVSIFAKVLITEAIAFYADILRIS